MSQLPLTRAAWEALSPDEQSKVLFTVLSDKRGFKMFVLTLTAGKGWTVEQLETLEKTVDAMADAFKVDASEMLLAIGDLQKSEKR